MNIKSVSGTVLYAAEGASTLREAVLSAVESSANLFRANLFRANLSGADLSGANLSRADLSRADLSGANLFRANLFRADLSSANLFRADLSGANLPGADLSGANLSGANLSSANLSRADLSGANLSSADLSGATFEAGTWEQVADKLTVAIQAMNDGGRHWIKGLLTGTLEDGSKTYCSIGSVEAHSEGTVRALAIWLLGSVTAGSISAFNDHVKTTWEDVQIVFKVAIMHAERFASTEGK